MCKRRTVSRKAERTKHSLFSIVGAMGAEGNEPEEAVWEEMAARYLLLVPEGNLK